MASFVEVMIGYTTNFDESIVNPKKFPAFLGVSLLEKPKMLYHTFRGPRWILRVVPLQTMLLRGMKTIRA